MQLHSLRRVGGDTKKPQAEFLHEQLLMSYCGVFKLKKLSKLKFTLSHDVLLIKFILWRFVDF